MCRHAARRPRPAAEHLPALRLPVDHRQHGRGARHPAHLVPLQARAQRQVSGVNISTRCWRQDLCLQHLLRVEAERRPGVLLLQEARPGPRQDQAGLSVQGQVQVIS